MNKIFGLFLTLLLTATFSVSAHDHHGKEGMGMGGNFKKIDTDGDKKISKEEWQKFHDARFTELDKDADGSVSIDEMKAYHGDRMSDKETKKEEKKSSKK